MTSPVLTAVSRTQGNNRSLKFGEVAPQFCSLTFEEVPVLVQAFRRMVRGLEFDVCEMAVTTYLCARRFGVAFTALPVFLVRGFHHEAVVVNRHAGIHGPKDLEGREVGVNRGYTVTTGVWARAILADEYEVDLDTVTWRPSGDEHVEAYEAPGNVAPLSGDATLAERVISGELPAAIGLEIDHPDVVPLIDQPQRCAEESLAQRGRYPINHLIVVRDRVLRRNPELAVDLFDAFARSKQRYVEILLNGGVAAPSAADRMHLRVHELTGSDPLPYGVSTNRAVLEDLIGHVVRQGILTEAPDVNSLFAAGTVELTG